MLATLNFAALPTNLARFDPNVRTPYSIQVSAGLEHQLHKSVMLTAGYRGQVQVKSSRSRDANAPLLPADPSIAASSTRPNANFGQIQQIESGGRSLLNAFDLGFRGQAGQWFSGQAQYTLSRFENNTGGIGWFQQDQYHPNAEWGRADQDRLSRFNLLGTIHPGHWLSLGVAATLYPECHTPTRPAMMISIPAWGMHDRSAWDATRSMQVASPHWIFCTRTTSP